MINAELLKEIKEKIVNADAILIGASNGLSITEGLNLFARDKAFDNLFGDIKRKYGITSILQGCMFNWNNEEEKWGYWSRLINYYSGDYKPSQVMKDLKAIVGNGDYFVITSNGECHFELSGFEESKVYEVEGNWFTMQCEVGCHNKIYPCRDLVLEMAKNEKDGKIPSELVPVCPVCKGNMKIHMADNSFIPEYEKQRNLQKFLERYHNKKLVVMELGIGPYNQLIKAPLMNLVNMEKMATYITINLGQLFIPEEIKNKSYGLDGYLSEILEEIRSAIEY